MTHSKLDEQIESALEDFEDHIRFIYNSELKTKEAKTKEQAKQALLEAFEAATTEIIGKDQDHAPISTLGVWSHDIAKFEYNCLRRKQRNEAIKVIRGEK